MEREPGACAVRWTSALTACSVDKGQSGGPESPVMLDRMLTVTSPLFCSGCQMNWKLSRYHHVSAVITLLTDDPERLWGHSDEWMVEMQW